MHNRIGHRFQRRIDIPNWLEPKTVPSLSPYIQQVTDGNNDGFHAYTAVHGFNFGDTKLGYGNSTAVFNKRGFWVRFTNVIIPPGTTILTATLEVVSMANRLGLTCRGTIKGNDIDNAIAPVNDAAYDALAKTAASVIWNPVAAPINTTHTSPDFASVVQEIVDRPGWVSGNAMMFLFEDEAGLSDVFALREWASVEHGALAPPIITIIF